MSVGYPTRVRHASHGGADRRCRPWLIRHRMEHDENWPTMYANGHDAIREGRNGSHLNSREPGRGFPVRMPSVPALASSACRKLRRLSTNPVILDGRVASTRTNFAIPNAAPPPIGADRRSRLSIELGGRRCLRAATRCSARGRFRWPRPARRPQAAAGCIARRF